MYNHKDGITLRKIEQSDMVDLTSLKKESWWGTHKSLIANSDDQLNWFKNIGKNQLYLIGELDGKSVGVVGYTNIDFVSRSLSMSGSVYKEFRSPDIVKSSAAAALDFAFEMLNMHRIEAEVLEYHNPAQNLEIDYLEFKVEGRKNKSVYKSGVYYDSIILGMLRQEWSSCLRVQAYQGSCNLNFDHQLAEKMIEKFNQREL